MPTITTVKRTHTRIYRANDRFDAQIHTDGGSASKPFILAGEVNQRCEMDFSLFVRLDAFVASTAPIANVRSVNNEQSFSRGHSLIDSMNLSNRALAR